MEDPEPDTCRVYTCRVPEQLAYSGGAAKIHTDARAVQIKAGAYEL